MGSYLGKNYKVFKCPADQSVYTLYGRTYPRVRSYSMNTFTGYPAESGTGGSSSPTESTARIRPCPSTPFPASDSPSRTFLFLDERPDSINDGVFSTDETPNNLHLRDVPAAYIGGAAGFSFADGHSIIHKWNPGWITQPIQRARSTTIIFRPAILRLRTCTGSSSMLSGHPASRSRLTAIKPR